MIDPTGRLRLIPRTSLQKGLEDGGRIPTKEDMARLTPEDAARAKRGQ